MAGNTNRPSAHCICRKPDWHLVRAGDLTIAAALKRLSKQAGLRSALRAPSIPYRFTVGHAGTAAGALRTWPCGPRRVASMSVRAQRPGHGCSLANGPNMLAPETLRYATGFTRHAGCIKSRAISNDPCGSSSTDGRFALLGSAYRRLPNTCCIHTSGNAPPWCDANNHSRAAQFLLIAQHAVGLRPAQHSTPATVTEAATLHAHGDQCRGAGYGQQSATPMCNPRALQPISGGETHKIYTSAAQVWDFDWSLVEENSDTWVLQSLSATAAFERLRVQVSSCA